MLDTCQISFLWKSKLEQSLSSLLASKGGHLHSQRSCFSSSEAENDNLQTRCLEDHLVKFCLTCNISFCQYCQSQALDVLMNCKSQVALRIEYDYEYLFLFFSVGEPLQAYIFKVSSIVIMSGIYVFLYKLLLPSHFRNCSLKNIKGGYRDRIEVLVTLLPLQSCTEGT